MKLSHTGVNGELVIFGVHGSIEWGARHLGIEEDVFESLTVSLSRPTHLGRKGLQRVRRCTWCWEGGYEVQGAGGVKAWGFYGDYRNELSNMAIIVKSP